MREWVSWLLSVVGYVYFAVCLQTIARKTGTRHGWMAWIPILDFLLMCWIAGRSGWWVLFFMVTGLINHIVGVILAIIFGIVLCLGIAGARGKPVWLGLLMCVPIVNLFAVGYLAFSDGKVS